MISFIKEIFKKLWDPSKGGYVLSDNKTCIVHGGEPHCTIIVEGVGLIEIPVKSLKDS